MSQKNHTCVFQAQLHGSLSVGQYFLITIFPVLFFFANILHLCVCKADIFLSLAFVALLLFHYACNL